MGLGDEVRVVFRFERLRIVSAYIHDRRSAHEDTFKQRTELLRADAGVLRFLLIWRDHRVLAPVTSRMQVE